MVRIFPLSDVPDEEADEIRAALTEAGIEFYETPPSSGRGYGAEAIWVANDSDAPAAFAVIRKHEAEWKRNHSPYPRRKTTMFNFSSDTWRFLLMLAITALFVFLAALVNK